MIVTFYSFKGGVGRSFTLVETAVQLAARGYSVAVWDLDLEAPGIQRIPDLRCLEDRLEIGTLDLVQEFLSSEYEFPDESLGKALIPFPLPEKLAANSGRLSFLLPGKLDRKYPGKFSAIDWAGLFKPKEGTGPAFFYKIAYSIVHELGYEILLIDSRTGYTDLGAVCTIQIPDLVVLVFNLNEQNLAGIEQVYLAVTRTPARHEGTLPAYLLANMIPSEPKKARAEKIAALAGKGLSPHHIVPLRPDLLLTDRVPTLAGLAEAAGDIAPVAQRIEERKEEMERLADKTVRAELSRAKGKADPEELEALRRRGIYEKAKTFEEKVAELFGLSGGRTTVDYKRDDMQFDVRVELTLGMFPVYLLVECKDTGRPVTQQQVREFASKVDYAAQADKLPYQGMLVARSQFANNAHTAAETLRIQLRTYGQLLLSLVDLRPNLDAAIRNFQGTALERLYVEQDAVLEADLRAGKTADSHQGLTPAVRRWLDEPGSTFLALLGDFGSGKTSFCKRIACELALQAREKPGDVRTPVLIDLREGGSTTVTLENLLTHHFQRLSNQPFNPQALLHLNREGYLLLIFDGFDETIGYTEPGRYLENLRQILRAAEGKAKVLLTCRTHYFRDRPEALRRLGQAPEVLTTQGATRLYEEIQDRPGSDIGYVLEFREEQIEEYLRKALPPPADWKAFREQIRNTYNLEDLAERPFLLEIIVKTLPRLTQRQGEVTIADLYESYCESWFSHTDFRLTLTRERRVALVEYLAQLIWSSPENRVHYDVLFEKATEFFQDRPLTLHDKERIDYEVRTALFLRRDAEGYYSFIHRSFLEFFIARTLRAGLAAGNPECLNLQRITREVAFFLEFWPEAKAIPSLTGKILSGEYQPEISENALILLYFHAWAMAGLEQLVGSKQERSADKQGLIRLREIFRGMRPQILNLRGANLEESALAGIDLSGAVLERACLIRANLRLATLNGADLKHASLQFANLRSALIEGVDLSDSDLRHADAREASFRLTHLERSNLSFGRFARVDMQDTQITGASTRGATFLNARLPQGFVLDPTAGPPLQDVFSVRGHFGHSHEVSKVAWSPDGRYLASASEDGTIILWDPTFGRLFQTSPENSSRIVDIAWSPDGNHIASACRDSTVKVWNIQNPSQTLVTLKGHRLSVFAVSWSPSGDRIASGSIDDSVIVWSREGKLIHTLEGHEKGVLTVRWSPDETMIASGSHDATIRLWDPSSGKLIRTLIGTKCSIFDLSWSRDSRSLAAANSNGSIVIWRTDSGTISSTIEGHKGIAYAVDWSPNNRQIASASADGAARIWDSVNGSLLGTLDGHSEGVSSVSWSPDGKQLATGSDDQTVRIWEAQSGKAVQTFQGDSNGVLSVAWAPDGQRLVSGSANNTGQIWDAESGAPIRTLDSHKDTIYTIRWSPDGRYIASGSFDHTVKIWASDDGRLLYTLEGHSTWIRGLTWEPSGKRLASSSDDHTIRIWNLPLKGAPRVLEHTEPVTAVSWSPAEPIVASASIDGIVRLWHADAGDLLHQLRNKGEWFFGVSWSPDGKYIAAGSYDQAVRIWHGSTGQLVHTFVGHQGIVRAIAWIPGGSVFASAAEDGTVKIWNFEKRKLLRTIKAVGSMVVDLAWAPNGSCLALASAQGFVELWSVKTKPRLLGRLHIVPGRGGFASIPDGYVSGPPEALEYVRFGDGWALYDLTDVPERFSPERVKAALNPSGVKKGTRRARKGRG